MAELRSSNPVLSRAFIPGSGSGRGIPDPDQLDRLYRQPARLTVDDVVIHTLGLFGIAGLAGAFGWVLAPDRPGVVVAAGLGALAIALVVCFLRAVNVPLVVLFALVEGFFVGGVSRMFEDRFSGIVLQALLGTGLVFVGMLAAYRSGRLRATPRMARIVFGTLAGVVLLSLVDLLIRVTTGSHLPIINDATPLGILFSLAILVVASLQFILDFDYIERAIASGAPRKEAWRAAFGLMISFAWVYLEMLRLLSKLRQ